MDRDSRCDVSRVPRYVFVLFIKFFFTVLTETNILCRQMEVAGPEKGPE